MGLCWSSAKFLVHQPFQGGEPNPVGFGRDTLDSDGSERICDRDWRYGSRYESLPVKTYPRGPSQRLSSLVGHAGRAGRTLASRCAISHIASIPDRKNGNGASNRQRCRERYEFDSEWFADCAAPHSGTF
jgi:hypothetical protein